MTFIMGYLTICYKMETTFEVSFEDFFLRLSFPTTQRTRSISRWNCCRDVENWIQLNGQQVAATQQLSWTNAIFEQSENDRDYQFINLRGRNAGPKILQRFKQYELFSIST
ncbi:hypothetical protein Plhal703r1_c06g0031321 [Plasmopara halstedii]